MTAPAVPTDTDSDDGDLLPSEPKRLELLATTPPTDGAALSVAPGVRWGRIPLPMALNHINVWLIEHEGGCVVVDTGLATGVGREAWQQIEAQIFSATPLRGIFLTHIHPDHVGLARWLQERHDVPVWMSARTHAQLELLMRSEPSDTSAQERFLVSHGASVDTVRPLLSPSRFAQMTSGMPEVERLVADGEVLHWGGRGWQALQTGGHAEGHLCLYAADSGALISGDQVLPTISANIGLHQRSVERNPLGAFFDSLARLRTLPADTWVLPSHGVPFRGLHDRIDELRSHHLEQLDNVVRHCDTPKTAAQLLPVMFRRPLEGVHFLLAMAEALSHLEYLVSVERLARDSDAHGVIRYRARS